MLSRTDRIKKRYHEVAINMSNLLAKSSNASVKSHAFAMYVKHDDAIADLKYKSYLKMQFGTPVEAMRATIPDFNPKNTSIDIDYRGEVEPIKPLITDEWLAEGDNNG